MTHLSAQAASRAAFRKLMWTVGDLARTAAQFDGVNQLDKARATAIVVLSGLSMPHIIGEAEGDDARELREALHGVALTIDPLVEAIGECASDNFHGVSKETFTGLIKDALGDVMASLDDVAERVDEDLREIAADPIGWAKAQALSVD